MNERNKKFMYLWHLARFLVQHEMVMSGQELADHLNRNKIRTSYGDEYEGGRGTYRLIQAVWAWINDSLGLPEEARFVAEAFVNADSVYAYE